MILIVVVIFFLHLCYQEIEILSRKVDEDEKIMSDRQSLIDDYAAMRESDKKYDSLTSSPTVLHVLM